MNYFPLFAFLFAGVSPRLRKASLVRNHETPTDFITDMYQSQLLKYTVMFSQVIGQFICKLFTLFTRKYPSNFPPIM